MSFGPTGTTKTAENNLSGTSNLALNSQLPMLNSQGSTAMGAGGNLFNLAGPSLMQSQPGLNYANTLLAGNAANTGAALQPNIDQTRAGSTASLSGINTLMPRGGGRSGGNYAASLAPQGQIQNLFNMARTGAASTAPQLALAQGGAIGGLALGEQGLGANLFGLANQDLNAANSANSTLGQLGQQQQQMTNSFWGGLGSGLFGLATTPFGGAGKSLFGRL